MSDDRHFEEIGVWQALIPLSLPAARRCVEECVWMHMPRIARASQLDFIIVIVININPFHKDHTKGEIRRYTSRVWTMIKLRWWKHFGFLGRNSFFFFLNVPENKLNMLSLYVLYQHFWDLLFRHYVHMEHKWAAFIFHYEGIIRFKLVA